MITNIEEIKKAMSSAVIGALDVVFHEVDFPVNRYYTALYEKLQAILHHTVSGEGVRGDINTWLASEYRIATPYIVARNGDIYVCFDDKYWAYHLGLKNQDFHKVGKSYQKIDPQSIGIEMDSWGGLLLGNGKPHNFGTASKPKWVNTITGKYYAVYGNVVDCEVVHYPEAYRGFYYFEKYTDKQLLSVSLLLQTINKEHNIPLDYNEGMFDLSPKALGLEKGVFGHTSYRSDKSDIHQQVELKQMLRKLTA